MGRLAQIFTVIIIFYSCSPSEEYQLNEEETWRLGWRMIENSMVENYAMAEAQFDSLQSLDKKIELGFIMTGIDVKNNLGKPDEVLEILSAMNAEDLKEACTYEGMQQLEPCLNLKPEVIDNPQLQLELIKMYVNDQAVRGNVMDGIIDKFNIDREEITDEDGMAVDATNKEMLQAIIKKYGFPTRRLVGSDAMNAIFLIVQHADQDKEWQKKQLVNIKAAVDKGDLDGQSYAYLHDRIQINSGQKQLYGTQFAEVNRENGITKLAPTEDLVNLDQRRREVGMMPIDMYKRFILQPF